mmetsp:Transcript_25417/g.29087  ORF Transcript_25417/g.29087 Transcript_25417/m.29087 type:complete len:603 (+) Transcript_25417:56-1864(+)
MEEKILASKRNKLLAQLKAQNCATHSDQVLHFLCRNEKILMCNSCRKEHKKDFAAHYVEYFDDEEEGVQLINNLAVRVVPCSAHPSEEAVFYCETEECFACSKCCEKSCSEEHKRHEVNELLKTIHERLWRHDQGCHKLLQNLKNSRSVLQGKMVSLKESEEAEIQIMDRFFDKLHEIINNIKENVTEEFRRECYPLHQEMREHEELATETEKNLSNLSIYIKKIIHDEGLHDKGVIQAYMERTFKSELAKYKEFERLAQKICRDIKKYQNPSLKINFDQSEKELFDVLNNFLTYEINLNQGQNQKSEYPMCLPNIKKLMWFLHNSKPCHILNNETFELENLDLEIDFNIPHRSRSIMTFEGKCYLSGGSINCMGSNKVYALDLENATLIEKSPMISGRYWHSLVASPDNYLYAIAGCTDPDTALARCERYDIQKDTWIEIAPLKTKKYAPTTCIYQKYASRMNCYLLYNFCGENETSLNEIEVYSHNFCSPEFPEREWIILKIPTPYEFRNRSMMCFQSSYNEIIICGGAFSRNIYRFEIKEKRVIKLANVKFDEDMSFTSDLYTTSGLGLYNDEVIMEARNSVYRYSVKGGTLNKVPIAS